MRALTAMFVTATALLAVSACSKPADTASAPKTAAASPAAAQASASTSQIAPPFNLKRSSATVEIDIALPAIPYGANAAARIRTVMEEEAKKFEQDAGTQAAEMKTEGIEMVMPFSLQVGAEISMASPEAVSLLYSWSEFQGGAHPNTNFTSDTFDPKTGETITLDSLFGPGFVTSPSGKTLAAALCTDLKARRAVRLKEAGIDIMDTECPALEGLAWTLAPGTIAGKAAGFIFHLDAYAIGSYAEGPYYGLVPLSVFEAALTPARKGLFAGTPKPLVDPIN